MVGDPSEAVHTITSQHEKWRFWCDPDRQHTNWFPIDGKFRCAECAKQRNTNPSVDPEVEQLYDQVTETYVSREQIKLDINPRPSANA